MMPFSLSDLAGAYVQAKIDREDRDYLRKERENAQKLAGMRLLSEGLAARGQMLGPISTPEEYASILPELRAQGLPTFDLPAAPVVESQAWRTFAKPAPAPAPAVPQWLPESMRPKVDGARMDLPGYVTETPRAPQLPEGPLSSTRFAGEQDAERIANAAQRGIPLKLQEQFADKSLGRALQQMQYEANLQKYEGQKARSAAEQKLRERQMQIQEEKLGLDRELGSANLSLKRRELETAGIGGQAIEQALKGLPALREEASLAMTGINTIDKMSSLLSTGAGARPGMIKTFLGRLTGVQTENMADAELYQLLSETLRGPLREDIVGPGPMTEAEQRLLGQVTGGGATGIKSAVELLAMYRRQAERKIQNYNRQREKLGSYDPTVSDLYESFDLPSGRPNRPVPAPPAPAPSASSLPPQAVAKLREGVQTRFGNGQIWTLRNGQPVQVK